jgi:hypothetical protein
MLSIAEARASHMHVLINATVVASPPTGAKPGPCCHPFITASYPMIKTDIICAVCFVHLFVCRMDHICRR